MADVLDVQKSIYDYQRLLVADIVNPDLDAVKLQLHRNGSHAAHQPKGNERRHAHAMEQSSKNCSLSVRVF
jgi:hypothetical protein